MQCTEKEITGFVASEDSSCAIGAMCSWSESEDQDSSTSVSESWYRFSPIIVTLKGGSFLSCNTGAIGAKAGATLTRNDLTFERGQCHGIAR